MRFHEQREHALRLLAQAGIGRNTYAPPLFRLLWRCGVQVRPPHFMGFGAFAALSGAWFGVTWCALMWIMFWSRQYIDAGALLIAACCAGLCFGLLKASYYASQRKKHGLPGWDSLA